MKLKKLISGFYACTQAEIKIQRDLSSYINDVYIPTSLIVCLSFISFFIDHKVAAARAPLGVSSILSNEKKMKCSYIAFTHKPIFYFFNYIYIFNSNFNP